MKITDRQAEILKQALYALEGKIEDHENPEAHEEPITYGDIEQLRILLGVADRRVPTTLELDAAIKVGMEQYGIADMSSTVLCAVSHIRSTQHQEGTATELLTTEDIARQMVEYRISKKIRN